MASLYRRLKRNDIAINHYNRSLQYAESVAALDFISFVNSELASLYEETGNFEKSLHYLKIAELIEDSLVNDETRKRLSEAEAFFQGELKEIDLQKKEFQLEAQHREKISYLAGMILLILLSCGLIWAYHKKIAAENKLKKHQEKLEEEVQQRTNELKLEMYERRAAEEADKLKTAFLANMSHEIRTPMNAILAFSNFLKDPDISGTQRNEYVKYINSCSKSLLHLIDDILDTAKIEAKQLKIHVSQCYVNSILNELNVYFQSHVKSLEGDITLVLKTDCVTRNYSLMTDGERLRQIFTNLLDNAFKFTEKGKIEFGFNVREGFMEFYVSDTGCGIPAEKAGLVFKRFGQVNNSAHKVYKGTGLGLSISKNLVELLGGKMWLESAEGKGSCFYFTIPSNSLDVTDLLERVTEENSPVIKLLNWEKFNLLVAEDDDLNYKLLQIALNKSNINLIRAKNGEEVLNLLPGKNIHLVLMDIQMPVLDGYEATRRLKALYPEIFVIAQTAFAMSDDKEKCLQAGCDDYISKPIDVEELYKKLTFFLEAAPLKN
jgi:signal transduction histidine kinase/ActR/RegA family two-component response regulator